MMLIGSIPFGGQQLTHAHFSLKNVNPQKPGSLTADIVNGARNLEQLYVNSNKMSGDLSDFAKASDLVMLRKLRLE
jgi:hypothetical protein